MMSNPVLAKVIASPRFQAIATTNVENSNSEEQCCCCEKDNVQHDCSSVLTLKMGVESQNHAQNHKILCRRKTNHAWSDFSSPEKSALRPA